MVNVWLTSVASIQGGDEERTISGRGWVTIKKDELYGHIFIHHGNKSGFIAKLAADEK